MEPYVIGLVGTTASNKTSLAVELARLIGAEIICADSRTIYADLVIGAARPTSVELGAIPHHLVGFLALDEMISSTDWRDLVDATIADITARSHPTIIVGGTRSMVEAALFTPTFAPLTDPERDYLSTLAAPELSDIARTMGVSRPLLAKDPSSLVTAIDHKRTSDLDTTLRYPGLIFRTPAYPRDVLTGRIIQRTVTMLDAGLVDEVLRICAATGRTPDEISSIGYRELAGLLTPAGLADPQRPIFIQRVTAATLDYAARQEDWLSTLPDLITLHYPTDALSVLPQDFHPNR